jgi:hypothetical protein
MTNTFKYLKFFIILLGQLPTFVTIAGTHSLETLAKSGVIEKDGMYYCTATGLFVRPYDTDKDVDQCAYALEEQKICSTSLNTKWISGRCFCPRDNRYLGYQPRRGRLAGNDPSAQNQLEKLALSVKKCDPFTGADHPFGRTVRLQSTASGYLISLMKDAQEWDSRIDFPGEQGNPHYPARISKVLELQTGFGCHPLTEDPIFPTLRQLIENINQLKHGDISFFEVKGELTGEEYLKQFIENRLPVAEIEQNGDATFYLHDLNFHSMGFLLLPRQIRELAQKQTRYLLEFIDFFKTEHPQEWKESKHRLMMQKLIEDQISRIDVGTGYLTEGVFDLLEKETSFKTFINSLETMDSRKKSILNFLLMRITGGDVGLHEKKSAKESFEDKEWLVLRAYERSDREGQKFYKNALDSFIKLKKSQPDFVEEIQIDSYDDVSHGRIGKYGTTAVDLFVDRLHELQLTHQ